MHGKSFSKSEQSFFVDAASALDLYHVHSLPIVNRSANMGATYDLETNKLTLSKDGLRYALPSEADYTKCIMASNQFCTLIILWYPTNTHILCVLSLFRNCGIDQYCRVEFSPYTSPQAVHLGQGNWVISTKKPYLLTITCLDREKIWQNHKWTYKISIFKSNLPSPFKYSDIAIIFSGTVWNRN